MLSSAPPQYQPATVNRQTVAPLSSPGVQGRGVVGSSSFALPSSYSLPSSAEMPSSMALPSSYKIPSSSPLSAANAQNVAQMLMR